MVNLDEPPIFTSLSSEVHTKHAITYTNHTARIICHCHRLCLCHSLLFVLFPLSTIVCVTQNTTIKQCTLHVTYINNYYYGTKAICVKRCLTCNM